MPEKDLKGCFQRKLRGLDRADKEKRTQSSVEAYHACIYRSTGDRDRTSRRSREAVSFRDQENLESTSQTT